MNQPETDVIAQAQELIRGKQLPKAQRLLVDYIKKNPNSEQAWYTLSTAVDDPRKQIECLQRVLRINPANPEAQARLMKVMAAQSAPPPQPPPPVEEPPQPAISEPAPYTFPGFTPEPLEEPAPVVTVPASEPPAEIVQPIDTASTIDTELAGLRSKAKFVKPRKPRKRGPRIILLLLLVLLMAAVAGRLLLDSLNQAANPPQANLPAEVVPPTNTPAPTGTPTVTLTPSITPTRYPPTWTPTPAPTTPPTRTPTPLPTFNPAVQTALLRVRDQVGEVRGIPTESDVPTALLPSDLVEATLRSILDIQQRQPELVDRARGLAALGLIRSGFDLSRYTINRFADNAGGFYIPWQNVVNVTGEEFGGLEGLVLAHQTAHALLDQRFDFSEWGLYPACEYGDDYCQARQALIEGDAALTTERWLEQSAPDLNREALPEFQALPPAVADPAAPLFITNDVLFRDAYGRQFVEALYRSNGWTAVNQAYEALPVSTEQIMHPDKYLEGEQPIAVDAVPAAGPFSREWQIVVDETLGEWRTYQLLAANVDEAARLSDETAQKAAAGWGGDHYRVYYDPQNDQTALVVEWVWDTPQDAAEFQQAMKAYLDLRFRGAKSQATDQDCWSANRQTTCLYSFENGTLWVLAPASALVDQLREGYPQFK
jgi:hypothetical protein